MTCPFSEQMIQSMTPEEVAKYAHFYPEILSKNPGAFSRMTDSMEDLESQLLHEEWRADGNFTEGFESRDSEIDSLEKTIKAKDMEFEAILGMLTGMERPGKGYTNDQLILLGELRIRAQKGLDE